MDQYTINYWFTNKAKAATRAQDTPFLHPRPLGIDLVCAQLAAISSPLY